jgi:hypothetical protein
MTPTTVPNTMKSSGRSRTNEMLVSAGRDVLVVRELQREQRERRRDHDLPGDLRPAAEAEALLLAGLQEVVDEADEPSPTIMPG